MMEHGMKKLRREDRAITDEEAIAILIKAEYGVLSTVSENGEPYGVPLNFCIMDRRIYFHCAMEGRKIDHIEKNHSVSFCAVGNTEVQPDQFAINYESAIASGDVEEVFDDVKQMALEGLLMKYSPGFMDQGKKYIETLKAKTRVFGVNIRHLSGKARRH